MKNLLIVLPFFMSVAYGQTRIKDTTYKVRELNPVGGFIYGGGIDRANIMVDTAPTYKGKTRILNKGEVGPGIWPTAPKIPGYLSDPNITWDIAKRPYTCTVVHLDGICPWDKPAPTTYPIYVIWSLKDKTSVVFATPGIHVGGKDLIRWKQGRYKPIPKTRKVIAIIKS